MTAQDLIAEASLLMTGKGEDYTKDPTTNQFENFDRSALIASWFNDESDKVFATFIATKLARLATLRNGKSPKNESVHDTFLDLINYSALWGAKVESAQSAELIAKNLLNKASESLYKPGSFISTSR